MNTVDIGNFDNLDIRKIENGFVVDCYDNVNHKYLKWAFPTLAETIKFAEEKFGVN